MVPHPPALGKHGTDRASSAPSLVFLFNQTESRRGTCDISDQGDVIETIMVTTAANKGLFIALPEKHAPPDLSVHQ